MRSIIEFALIAWVTISVFAVLVQLIKIARYKRTTKTAAPVHNSATQPESNTINLDSRLAPTTPPTAPVAEDQPVQVLAGASTTDAQAPQAATQSSAAPVAPAAPKVTIPPAAVSVPAPTAPPVEAAAVSTEAAPTPESAPTPATPTLADLLAGVRLPWNLLPTVDQSCEPSNDRVVLITSEGEPSKIGVDVADELERLGFAIAPRGDDTAVATRDGHSLGLRIIEEPITAEVDGTRRFPTATESSVALDIWVE